MADAGAWTTYALHHQHVIEGARRLLNQTTGQRSQQREDGAEMSVPERYLGTSLEHASIIRCQGWARYVISRMRRHTGGDHVLGKHPVQLGHVDWLGGAAQ